MITSPHNPGIKNIIKLAKSRERRKQQLFLLEGARELTLALQGGYRIQELYVCREMLAQSKYPELLNSLPKALITEISSSVFAKIAYRKQSDGVVAVLRPKRHHLDDLVLRENPFVIVLESVEKPGNLGAILRTADAAAVDAVVICDPLTDLYNPNVIRSGIGTLFTVPVAVCTSEEALSWLNKRKISIYAAELKASEFYHDIDFKFPSAIVMGTEADGLTDFWIHHATKRVKIPMRGEIDSLNVSVSTAILTFEAMRQRGF